jgi:hypothetical protein
MPVPGMSITFKPLVFMEAAEELVDLLLALAGTYRYCHNSTCGRRYSWIQSRSSRKARVMLTELKRRVKPEREKHSPDIS